MEIQSDKKAITDIRNSLVNENYKEAFQILKRNPMAPLSKDDARMFLNNLNSLSPGLQDPDANQKQVCNKNNKFTFFFIYL